MIKASTQSHHNGALVRVIQSVRRQRVDALETQGLFIHIVHILEATSEDRNWSGSEET